MVVPPARTLDRVFAALADPTRRAIVARLERSQATISDLAGPFDMTLPAVSKHLRVLGGAGLVRVRKRGRSRFVTLRPGSLGEAAAWLDRRARFWHVGLGALKAMSEAKPDPTR
ncbi:MAG: ArsR/SmtB family transcription factor [Phycisphaerales bacterium]